eukprot:7349007-Alexandrium_andersonii.AAC.1
MACLLGMAVMSPWTRPIGWCALGRPLGDARARILHQVARSPCPTSPLEAQLCCRLGLQPVAGHRAGHR